MMPRFARCLSGAFVIYLSLSLGAVQLGIAVGHLFYFLEFVYPEVASMRGWKYKQVGTYHCITRALLLFYAGSTVFYFALSQPLCRSVYGIFRRCAYVFHQ